MLENAGSIPSNALPVLNVSAPEILQRPAPQPGAPLFGAPRPERPSAPANPAAWRSPESAAREEGRGGGVGGWSAGSRRSISPRGAASRWTCWLRPPARPPPPPWPPTPRPNPGPALGPTLEPVDTPRAPRCGAVALAGAAGALMGDKNLGEPCRAGPGLT